MVLDCFRPMRILTTPGSSFTSLRTVSLPMAHWVFRSVMLKCFSKVESFKDGFQVDCYVNKPAPVFRLPPRMYHACHICQGRYGARRIDL